MSRDSRRPGNPAAGLSVISSAGCISLDVAMRATITGSGAVFDPKPRGDPTIRLRLVKNHYTHCPSKRPACGFCLDSIVLLSYPAPQTFEYKRASKRHCRRGPASAPIWSKLGVSHLEDHGMAANFGSNRLLRAPRCAALPISLHAREFQRVLVRTRPHPNAH